MLAAAFTPREVAELAGVPKHVIEKAIEERVLPLRARGRGVGRRLPAEAVVYARLVSKLDLKLSAAHKRRLFGMVARLRPAALRKARVELLPAVEINVGLLVGDVLDRAERYRKVRDSSIKIDDSVMGGTPVIRGTRISVYSILGRIEHGEAVDDILEDNPDLKREVVEAAITFARAHPPMGRPSGRPWKRAA